MRKLSSTPHELESLLRAAKRIRLNLGSLAAAIAALLAMSVATYSIGIAAQGPAAKSAIRTLSTHADRVSGGDVLVEIILANANLPFAVFLNGRNVSDAFHPGETTNSRVGLVTGLLLGKNLLLVIGGGLRAESLVLTNYSIKGPIVSGPHLQPFICQTQDFTLPDGTKLGPATDADCSAPTKVNYIYRSTAGAHSSRYPVPRACPRMSP